MKRKILKFLIISIILLPILLFIHTGFSLDSSIKNLQLIIFTLILSSAIIWPILRKYFFLISLVLIIGMAFLFIIGMIEWADNLGSTSIGIIILLLLSYLPVLIKQGYIEKL